MLSIQSFFHDQNICFMIYFQSYSILYMNKMKDVLNISDHLKTHKILWKQQPTKQQLYDHLPPISLYSSKSTKAC